MASSRVIFNHNTIICDTKEDAILLAKATTLSLGEPVAIKYKDPDDATKVKVVIAIGTGHSENPVDIINAAIPSFHIGPTPPDDPAKLWIDTSGEAKTYDSADTVITKMMRIINTLTNRIERLEYAFSYGIECGTTSNISPPDNLATVPVNQNLPMTYEDLLKYDPEKTEDDYTGIAKATDVFHDKVIEWVSQTFPNLTHLSIKHDTAANIERYTPKNHEFIFDDTNKVLYLGYEGKKIRINYGSNQDL